MKKIFICLISSFILSGNLFALDLGDISSVGDAMSVSKGKSSYFKNINNSVTDCIASKLSGKLPNLDICTLEKGINHLADELDSKIKSAFSIDAKFNIAGCSFKSKLDPVSCLRNKLKTSCSNRNNPLRKNKIKNGTENYMLSATHDIVEYSDSEIAGNVCMTFAKKKAKDPIHSKVYGNNKYENGFLKTYGSLKANSRVVKTTLKCIEDAKRSGYDENSCFSKYDNINADESDSKISELDVRKAIHEQATVTLASPFKNKISDMRNKEIDLTNKLAKSCKDKGSQEEVDSCVEDFLKNTYQIDREISEQQVAVTKNIAALSEAIDTATTPSSVMVFPTENAVEKLPIQKREKYKRQSVRYMSQKTLIQSQLKRVAKIEKEMAALMYKKIEVTSKPFSIKATKNELGLSPSGDSESGLGLPSSIGSIGL